MTFESYTEFIKPVWDQVNIYDGVEPFEISIKQVSRPALLVYAANFCLSEIYNGGFLQLFWNNTGILTHKAIEGFQVIGMPRLAATVASAAAIFGPVFPIDRDERWDALLVASKLTKSELEKIFAEAENLYLAFEKATEPLAFDLLNEQAWALATEENGDFSVAATAYANTSDLIQ